MMRLMEEGHLKLEDPVSKYLPAFADCQVKVGARRLVKLKRPILIKQLLVHQSGVAYAPDFGDKVTDPRDKAYSKLQTDASDGKITSLADFTDRLAKIPLSFQPGENYEYGFSYDIAARILEVVTGKDVEDVLNEYVFQPLGMHETSFSVKDDKLHKLAGSYCGKRTWKHVYGHVKGKKPVMTKTGLYRIDGKKPTESNWRHGRHLKVKTGGGFMGYRRGGGLVSNVSDTVKLVRMLMSKGRTESGDRFLKEATLKICEKDRNKKSWGQGGACYIGNVGVFREGSDDVGMGGASCTYWSIDRKDRTATAWFTQNMDMPEPGDLEGVDPKAADLWSLLHEAIIKKKAGGKRSSPSVPIRQERQQE
jgi:CubicO group peptidase (beta-lactamase class C family)